MTVSSTTNRKEYTGNGATVEFAISPVVIFATSDLEVYVVTTATGVATPLVENTDYTVTTPVPFDGTATVDLSGGASPYGAPSASQTLVIVRNLPLVQETDFVQNDPSDAEVAEDAFDYATMVMQQLSARVDRSFRLSDSDASGGNTVLPEIAERASKFWTFDANGDFALSTGSDGTGGALSLTLALTTAGNGASLIGVQDAGGLLTATTVEAALAEIAGALNTEEAALAAHLIDSSAAHAASAISFTPAGSVAATDVQAAIAEIDGDVAAVDALIDAHIADSSAAHAASAISYAGGTGMSATDVEAAIDELATEKANDSAVVKLAVEDQTLTGGVVVTSKDLGTISSGTVTPDPGDRPMQHYINGGAHTLAPSGNGGSALIDITNNASAGAITTSGFTKVTGDVFTTTNGHKFRCHISVGNGGSLLQVQALQ